MESEIPNARSSPLYCPCQVPLWVALNLRQRQKCRIVQPEWMTPERLEAARDAERESPFFAELPASDQDVTKDFPEEKPKTSIKAEAKQEPRSESKGKQEE